MLFTMGLGSRISKNFKTNLLHKFLYLEFALSFLVAFAPLTVYTVSGITSYLGLFIYGFCLTIGLMIGMEIPLVMRINEQYEELRVNISGILENDYYGSLLGGVFFAFIGLPIMGLTYTPFLLGFVNFSVAVGVLIFLLKRKNNTFPWAMSMLMTATGITLITGIFLSEPIIQYGEQLKYKDKVVYTQQSKYQRIVITQWKNHHWLYLNGNQQLCTIDEVMYHEPLVHPPMSLHPNPQQVLVLGGGDGCAVREVLKYNSTQSITLVDLDPAVTQLGKENPIFTQLNRNALNHPKVNIINTDGFHFLENSTVFFDIIIVDLPDPRSVEMGRLYSYEFYSNCYKHLRPGGILITQAGSPYFATQAFLCIEKTMKEANFQTIPLHNQVITLGEWGWVMGVKSKSNINLKQALQNLSFENIETAWINQDAMQLITAFGKNIYPNSSRDSIKINYVHAPVLYKYYLNGNWDIY